MNMEDDVILQIKDLVIRFYTYEGVVKAVENVSMFLRRGEILGIVGETGCGKTITSLSTLKLVPHPGRIEGGEVYVKTDDGLVEVTKMDERSLEGIRGRYISIVFQEPGSALNPLMRVGDQIAESLLTHRGSDYYSRALKIIDNEIKMEKGLLKRWRLMVERKLPLINRVKKLVKNEVRRDVISLLKNMGMPDPEKVYDMYPHQLSGGMKQRIVIAMALACNPSILIADEPTTNLDVTIEAQILELIKNLQSILNLSIMYITHDLGIIAELAHRVVVMYAGSVCEVAEVHELFKNPLHPYTKALLESIPRPNKPFKSILGTIPNLVNPPSGCRFHPRCSHAMENCRNKVPKLMELEKDHYVACFLYER